MRTVNSIRRVLWVLSAAALLLVGAVGVAAQDTGVPGDGTVSISLYAGNFNPTHEVQGPIFGTNPFKFESNPAFGGTIGKWFTRYAGVRANGLWTETVVNNSDAFPLDGRDASLLMYSFDVLFRYPVEAGFGYLLPYAVAGAGAKYYSFDIDVNSSGGHIDHESPSDFALNLGVGAEYRFASRFGISVELKDYWSKFGVAGIEGPQHDVVMTGGVSVQF